MKKLLDLIYSSNNLETWSESASEAFQELFGSSSGRYSERAKNAIQIRAPKFRGEDDNVPFATLIERSNPTSGPFGGMCVGVFPVKGAPCLLGLGIGTTGLHPDETILSRPGHARKAKAICDFVNGKERRFAAWAKHDPTRNDLRIPENVAANYEAYNSPLSRYGKELYAIYEPSSDQVATELVLKAFLDLFFEERGYSPLAAFKNDADAIKANYFGYLMPDVGIDDVARILDQRRFVVLEGPPGTGKTRTALELLKRK